MQESSSGGNRNARSSQNRSNGGRKRSRNRRSGGNGRESRQDSGRWKSQPDEFRPSEIVGRNRRRESRAPQLTGFQKFIKFITFGLVDPSAKKATPKKTTKPARETGEKRGKRDPKSGTSEKGATSSKRERRAPHYVEPTTPRLYVGNLSFDVTSADLQDLFAAHGSVVEAAVVTRSGTDKSKGFAFVEMGSVEEAKAAAAALNDHELQGRKMLVTGAKSEGAGEDRSGEAPRGERPARSSGRGERRGRSERSRGESDEIDKPSRQVRPLVIETVTSPSLNVLNVNAEAGENDLTDLFSGIGSIVSREEIGPGKDDRTKNHRIDLADTAEAQKAVELLHGKCFMGHEIQVTGANVGA